MRQGFPVPAGCRLRYRLGGLTPAGFTERPTPQREREGERAERGVRAPPRRPPWSPLLATPHRHDPASPPGPHRKAHSSESTSLARGDGPTNGPPATEAPPRALHDATAQAHNGTRTGEPPTAVLPPGGVRAAVGSPPARSGCRVMAQTVRVIAQPHDDPHRRPVTLLPAPHSHLLGGSAGDLVTVT